LLTNGWLTAQGSRLSAVFGCSVRHLSDGMSPVRRLTPPATYGLLLLAALTVGCRQDMHDQPNYQPLEKSDFFGDGQASRPLLAGTVPRGHLKEDALLYTGTGPEGDVFPFRVDAAVMARGRERYNIYCTPCHGQTGVGDGMIVRRGYQRPPALDDERLRGAPHSYLFDVITNGFGAMPDYGWQIPAADRWAIIAFVRALQLSGHASLDDVPAAERGRLDQTRTTPAEARGAGSERR
jgi:mono/diheme cytochrome c family protein